MKNLFVLICVALIISSSGCIVDCDSPVLHDSSTVNTSVLIGTWRVTHMFGNTMDDTNGYTEIIVTNPISNTLDGDLKKGIATYSEYQIEITNIGSTKIASFSTGNRGWEFVKYTLTDSNQTLNLYYPKFNELLNDIETSTVSGSIEEYNHDRKAAYIDASGSSLRSYISSNLDIFPSSPTIVFSKQ